MLFVRKFDVQNQIDIYIMVMNKSNLNKSTQMFWQSVFRGVLVAEETYSVFVSL